MIVLGSQLVAHHLLEGVDHAGDGDGRPSGDAAPCNDEVGGNDAVVARHAAASGDSGSCNNSYAPSEKDVTKVDAHMTNQWTDARLKVSGALGSIGAPPLAPSSENSPSTRIICNDVSDPKEANTTQKLNDLFCCILGMANAHADLIQTLNRVMGTLSIGTSVRLGLGPITAGDGNGRLVARAEKAWAARHLRPIDDAKSSEAKCNMQSPSGGRPGLALQKLRNILQQAIVDQAVSLQGVLNTMPNSPLQRDESASASAWEEFAHDVQHSREMPHVLTLSQLSAWINDIGGFLSHVLSGLLDWQCIQKLMLSDNARGATLAALKHSWQLAHERVAFLYSACPTAQPSEDERIGTVDTSVEDESHAECNSAEDQTAQLERQRRRRAERTIQHLQSTLEAARVSLWAFEQSCTSTDNDPESRDMWWSQFREMMERSCASIPAFEEQMFPTAQDADEEAGCDGANKCAEHISDVTLLGAENKSDGEQPHANKTLVFSGSGAKQPRPPTKRTATSSDTGAPPPVSFSAADQTLLLRDLERRIKTIGLAEEHEVTNDGAEATGGLSENATTGAEATKSQPLFLGVPGSMLADLTSAIARNGASGSERVV